MLLPEWSVCFFPFTGPTGGRITRTPDIFPRHSIVSKKLYLFPMTRVKGLYKGSDSSSYLRVPGYTEAECVGTDVAQYTTLVPCGSAPLRGLNVEHCRAYSCRNGRLKFSTWIMRSKSSITASPPWFSDPCGLPEGTVPSKSFDSRCERRNLCKRIQKPPASPHITQGTIRNPHRVLTLTPYYLSDLGFCHCPLLAIPILVTVASWCYWNALDMSPFQRLSTWPLFCLVCHSRDTYWFASLFQVFVQMSSSQ